MSAKRGRRLAELIMAESERAGLGPGSRLPTERQLGVELGVTRSGVRVGVGALEADGLVSREVGRGTFFSDTAFRNTAFSNTAGQAFTAQRETSGEVTGKA